MAQFAIMAGGAILNTVAFSGSNSLFSMLSSGEVESRNKALAQLQIDKEKLAEKWVQLPALANEELQRQDHALQSFKNNDDALEEYYSLTNINLESYLEKEPTFAAYYSPSDCTKHAEIIGITVGMAITAYFAYRYSQGN